MRFHARHRYLWNRLRRVLSHSGAVLLLTQERYEQRKRWGDAQVQRVEGLIADFVAALMQTAIALCHQEDELKQREADQQKRAPKRAQLQKDIQVEEEKLEQFRNAKTPMSLS